MNDFINPNIASSATIPVALQKFISVLEDNDALASALKATNVKLACSEGALAVSAKNLVDANARIETLVGSVRRLGQRG